MRFQTARPDSWQVCIACGNETTELDPHPRCVSCGGLLEIQHRPPTLTPAELIERFTERRGQRPGALASGVWRFREIVLPSAKDVISHPEGNTPLLHRDVIDRWTGADRLLLKHEGHNPTGSFKDRGMTVGVTQARRIGRHGRRLRLDRQHVGVAGGLRGAGGNPGAGPRPGRAGGAWASWRRRSRTAPRRCWSAATSTSACGWSRRRSQRLGVYLLNSINPFRIEGQKTIVLEMLAATRAGSRPTGSCCRRATSATRRPSGRRCARPTRWGSSPACLASPRCRRRAPRRSRAASRRSSSTATRCGPRPSRRPSGSATRRRSSAPYTRSGRRTASCSRVTDADILEAKAVVDGSGVGCEPASAASVAGVRDLIRRGLMAPEHHAVAVLTGHILKDPGLLLEYHREMDPPPPGANRPIEIVPELEAIERVLAGG